MLSHSVCGTPFFLIDEIYKDAPSLDTTNLMSYLKYDYEVIFLLFVGFG